MISTMMDLIQGKEDRAGHISPAGTAQQQKVLTRTHSIGSSTRYPLITEIEVQVCRITHSRSLLQKVIYSRHLRRWEGHMIILNDNYLHSTTPKGYMTYGLAYSEIREVVRGANKENGSPYTLHLVIPRSGSLLFQVMTSYNRDKLFYSLVWKITACRFRKLFSKIKKPTELITEMQELVHFCLTTPISDPVVFKLPMNSISHLLLHHGHEINDELRTEVIKVLSPILEMNALTPSICKCFQRITRYHPHVALGESFVPSVHRVLKYNTDFGKFPHLRMFVQDYICYVHSHDESKCGVSEFTQSLHTANTSCPHPRALPNLVTIALAAVYSVYEEDEMKDDEKLMIKTCFKELFLSMAQYDDWRPQLAILLQAVPFPQGALSDTSFNDALANVVTLFARDKRCVVHQCIFSIREDKMGWVHHFAPGGVCCNDDGKLFSTLMSCLIPCCCTRRKMLIQLKDNMRPLFTLMAIRGNKDCIEALIALLEFGLIEKNNDNLEIVAALQSSDEGRKQYEELCSKRIEFLKMKRSGGPHKLTLPCQSTDEDLIHVLKSGSFGNLLSLNLAFTKVTSESAKYIIQLPSLLHLNLWGTSFDDDGLQLICEHLRDLQSLNLSENSMITDDGLTSLIFLENLQTLNLNSTNLSALTYEVLKEKLTNLQVLDIRYTEAYDIRYMNAY